MCERDNLEAWDRQGGFDWTMNRRRFVAAGALGALAACAPRAGEPGGMTGVSQSKVSVPSPDGAIDAFFVHPMPGRYPAVLLWPDIAGLREAFETMARRLAMQGYAVLVVNPYYRDTPAPQFADFAAFRAQGGFEKVGPWREKLTPDAVMRDAAAAVAWLDARDEVDSARGIGTHGYCMGGPFTVFSAAAVPDRVRAAASLHGGGLVKEDDPQSPHRLLAETQARYLFAIAQNDDAQDPDAKTKLRAAAEAAGVPATVEVFPADHGWTVIDSPAYDREAAERAWAAMSALFAGL